MAVDVSQNLVAAMQQLNLQLECDDAVDVDVLFERQESSNERPFKAHKVDFDIESYIHKTQAAFLTPPSALSSEAWLNRLQQRWDCPIDYHNLFAIAAPVSRTVTRLVRRGLEGRVVGYRDVSIPAHGATANNSTSLLRKPTARADFVRGAAGSFPFAPGGLDGIHATAQYEDSIMRAGSANSSSLDRSVSSKLERVIQIGPHNHLLEVAPGLTRGIVLKNSRKDDMGEGNALQSELEREPEALPEGQTASDNPNESTDDPLETGDIEDIDSILPIEFPALEPHGVLEISSSKKAGRDWAHMVDMKKGIPNFKDLVPDMAREWPFELDTFQKEAIYHLECGDSVFVAAHTSAGKTVVAEYAIALAVKHMTKAIYTSPIKALSNQKFRDFRQIFSEVGILTGDVQINPEASCLIMTTEILRSMLYRGADLIRDVEYVIFDEVHYVNDLERGVVWEEVIIMLPDHVSLILLSATVPNTHEFASWVGRTKKKDIYVISTSKRPVPLEHYLWAGKQMHKIVESGKFLEAGWKQAHHAGLGKEKVKPLAPEGSQRRGKVTGGRGEGGGAQRGAGATRGSSQLRGRGVPHRAGHNPGHMGRTGRVGGRTTQAQDKTLWVHVVQHLKKESLLPACIFVFSKRRCEENADALGNQDFCTAKEKSAIHMISEKSIARLKADDRLLPQIVRLRGLLQRGIAVHHGGLLPIVKELVEILFAQTFVKVLFATETFAMGLNLPTRTVVFSGYRKHDGHSFRNLLPGEYTQMAGRAGRRGLDSVGTVIVVPPGGDEAPPASELQNMILGQPSILRSQFRLTYNMILNLLRVEALKIEEIIKRSFSEHATQQLLPENERAVKLSEADLARVKRDTCSICDEDMDNCHQASQTYRDLTTVLYSGLAQTQQGRQIFCPRRLIVFQKDGVRSPGLLVDGRVILKGSLKVPILQVREIRTKRSSKDDSDLLPYLPEFRKFFTSWSLANKDLIGRTLHVPLVDVECVTGTVAKGIIPELFLGGDAFQSAKIELQKLFRSFNGTWNEAELSRIRTLELQEAVEKRKLAKQTALSSAATLCNHFLKHFAMCHDQWLIKERIAELRQSLSDQNLQLLPDYEQRIQVLKDLGFVDQDSRILLKGKVACEIHSADELVLTELILENVLADYEPAEIAALLSAFVFQEKTDVEPKLTGNLERAHKRLVQISDRVNQVQVLHQVVLSAEDSNDFVYRPRFGLTEVVYEWARGMSFRNITGLTDVLEGTIVRTISRLDETCREVKNAARIIGDPGLYQKMQAAQELISRDITAVASLYI